MFLVKMSLGLGDCVLKSASKVYEAVFHFGGKVGAERPFVHTATILKSAYSLRRSLLKTHSKIVNT